MARRPEESQTGRVYVDYSQFLVASVEPGAGLKAPDWTAEGLVHVTSDALWVGTREVEFGEITVTMERWSQAAPRAGLEPGMIEQEIDWPVRPTILKAKPILAAQENECILSLTQSESWKCRIHALFQPENCEDSVVRLQFWPRH